MATIADTLAEGWRCFRSGDRQRASALAFQILQADADQVGALGLLGAVYLAQNQLPEAAHSFRQVLRHHPEDAACHSSLGIALARQGKHTEALPHFREVLRLTPDSAEAHNNLGVILKNQGQLEEAERLFHLALRLSPGFQAAYNNLGVALKMQGKLDEALACLQHALQLDPGCPETHHNLGLVLKQQKKFQEAEARFRQAIRLRPGYAEAHSALGNTLREQERLAEAEASCRQALRISPESSEVHNNLALVLQAQDKPDEALNHLRQALRLKPRSVEVHNNLGQLLQEQGRLDEALASYRQALHLAPDSAEVHGNLGVLLLEMARLPEAEATLQQALRLEPDLVAAHSALGGVLQELGKPEEAEARYQEALRLQPDPLGHSNVGLALLGQGSYAKARAHFERALTLQPDHVESLINLGELHTREGSLEEAEACLLRALRVAPDLPEVHTCMALHALLRGDFERGWAEHEWRRRAKNTRRSRRNFPQPAWDGSSLAGRTILLCAEHGLGDTLHFIRYAALVKQRGGTVLCEAPASLVPLLARCHGIDRVIAPGSALPDFDVHVPLLSLPFLFGTRLDTIPAAVPYLEPDPDLVARWRRELAPLPGFKVGIGWQGNPRYFHDRIRSFPLARYEPLARLEGVRLFSLQKGPGKEQIAEFAARFPLTDLGCRLDETSGAFMDTAAVLQSLDLVITSDTALAHLAGALGVPVWLAVARVPEWRWLLDREDSPWYPTMRLFRQQQPGDWHGVFARLADELARRLKPGSAKASPTPPPPPAGQPGCGPIQVEMAPGELIDRMTILEIKNERIQDPAKRANVEVELAALRAAFDRAIPRSPALDALRAELRAVNEVLWQIEDDVRLCERDQDFGPRFIELARSVYRTNDRRAALKRQINELLNSRLREEKAYASSEASVARDRSAETE